MPPEFASEPVVGSDLSHAQLLRLVAEQSAERGFDDVLIVDSDFHHFERRVWPEILARIDNDVVRHFLSSGGGGQLWIPGTRQVAGIHEVGGRIQVAGSWYHGKPDLPGAEGDLALAREALDAMGSNYASFFPTYLLDIGMVPQRELEPHIVRAWAEWVCELILPEERRLFTMLPLPLSDPEACLRLVEDFGDVPGVAGFMVTTTRHEPIFTKPYMKLYRALEERDLPLGFHGAFTMGGEMRQFNRFISVHALGFPLFQMIHVTNWIVNGLPERFPNLKVLFIEGGLAWVPFLMQRLDHEFLMRSSEAPLLKRRPSEYMREFFYTSQPLEASNLRQLESTFEVIGAKTQLLWASDWPHWDWDPPRSVWDLPFIDDETRRNILGENARRVFDLAPAPDVAPRPADGVPVPGRAAPIA